MVGDFMEGWTRSSYFIERASEQVLERCCKQCCSGDVSWSHVKGGKNTQAWKEGERILELEVETEDNEQQVVGKEFDD